MKFGPEVYENGLSWCDSCQTWKNWPHECEPADIEELIEKVETRTYPESWWAES
jgi:organic radical activating enzyme